jgi:2-polyprenyl-6-methoxyphenol hydroxylase-like FAD-dependent oxidoreductase
MGPDGREEEVLADWLVGCDGAHSIVRHSLGATFDGETNESGGALNVAHLGLLLVTEICDTNYFTVEAAIRTSTTTVVRRGSRHGSPVNSSMSARPGSDA